MLKTRVLTAAALLMLFLSALLLLPDAGWIGCCAVMLGVAAWEWGGLVKLGAAGRWLWTASVVGLFVIPLALPGSWGGHAPRWMYYLAAGFWAAAPLWIWKHPTAFPRLVMCAVGVGTLLAAASALVDLRRAQPSVLVAILATVWVSDTAAYFVGRRFGKHKLAPAISPGKSWEGVAGALAAVAAYALAWSAVGGSASMPVALDGTRAGPLWILPVLLGLAGAGIIGDLFESLLKRQAGVKDSGTIFPGHGGMLDRIDAPLAMLPLAVLAFTR
jgi:phosphatidate cytidylyltransferase